MKTSLTRADIMPMDDYGAVRKERRTRVTEIKKHRRMAVGPFATFYFENYETMWHQVHEMLFIERGGDAQIDDELSAYNPLIPNGQELVATVMLEITDAIQRQRTLARLGGFEETITLSFDGHLVQGVPEADIDRTTADGKASSVQFIHFPFTTPQIDAFRSAGAQIIIGIGHENYQHMAVMPEPVRAALAGDFA